MKVEVKPLSYLLLSDALPGFTTFPVMKTSPLTLLLHAPQLLASQIVSLHAATYHLAVLMMMTSFQFIAHLIPAPHYH